MNARLVPALVAAMALLACDGSRTCGARDTPVEGSPASINASVGTFTGYRVVAPERCANEPDATVVVVEGTGRRSVETDTTCANADAGACFSSTMVQEALRRAFAEAGVSSGGVWIGTDCRALDAAKGSRYLHSVHTHQWELAPRFARIIADVLVKEDLTETVGIVVEPVRVACAD